MATFYWVARLGSWSGSMAGTGTESAPFIGAIGLRNAFQAGTIPATGGHTIIFMGEHGSVLQPEIEADFPNTDKTITQPLVVVPWSGPACVWAMGAGGILLGNHRNHTSNCRDNTFQFRGSQAWHIDCRGATTNAGRMIAGLVIQGTGNKVQGLRLAQADFNYIGSGRIPATGITYAAEASYENHGLILWGGFGCEATNCHIWGSNAFGNVGIELQWMNIDAASNTNKPSKINYNEVHGQYRGIHALNNSGAASGSAPAVRTLPVGSGFECAYNEVYDSRWGDTAATPVINNAMAHAGHVTVENVAAIYSTVEIHHNDTHGWCQDSLEVLGYNADVYSNHVHDINQGYTIGGAYSYWEASGPTWVVNSSGAANATAIKLGLSSYDGVTNSASYLDNWLPVGTVGGSINVPATWNKAYWNRIHGGMDNGIRTNGSSGSMIHANEIYDCGTCVSISANSGLYASYWISHNYMKPGFWFNRCLGPAGDKTIYLYNNILDGASVSGTAYTWSGAAGKAYGASNVITGSVFDTGNMTSLTGTIGTAPAYTIGVGPTAGGNCASGGSRAMLLRAGLAFTAFDIDGNPWKTGASLPIGPRQA